MSSKIRSIKRNGQTKPELTAEESARNTLLEEQKKREHACFDEVTAALTKYNCQLVAVFQWGDQNIPVSKLVNLKHSIIVGSK